MPAVSSYKKKAEPMYTKTGTRLKIQLCTGFLFPVCARTLFKNQTEAVFNTDRLSFSYSVFVFAFIFILFLVVAILGLLLLCIAFVVGSVGNR